MITDKSNITPLCGSSHVSPETAFVVTNYPYGFRLRCQKRYWLEHHKTRGTRLVTQTSNPKRPGLVWNRPDASTYAPVAGALYLDAAGHVQWTELTYYADVAELKSFLATFGAYLPEALLTKVRDWLAVKTTYETVRAEGEFSSGPAATIARLVSEGVDLETAKAKVRAALQAKHAEIVAGQPVVSCLTGPPVVLDPVEVTDNRDRAIFQAAKFHNDSVAACASQAS